MASNGCAGSIPAPSTKQAVDIVDRNLPAVRRHDHLFAPIESLASLGFGENRITNTDLSKPADPALKKVIVDPGYEFELVTTLFKNRPDVSILTE